MLTDIFFRHFEYAEFDGIIPYWHSFHNGKGLNEIPVLLEEWRSRLKLPQATRLEAHISARAQKLIMEYVEKKR